jgi:hypothetical protein
LLPSAQQQHLQTALSSSTQEYPLLLLRHHSWLLYCQHSKQLQETVLLLLLWVLWASAMVLLSVVVLVEAGV